jgi:hypothetical protein
MLDFNKHRSFTKYYIINGTTDDHQSILTGACMHALSCNSISENMAVNEGVEDN